MNASIRGIMFVKADRINERVKQIRKTITGRVSQETIDDFVKTVEIIVNSELTQKGYEGRRDYELKKNV